MSDAFQVPYEAAEVEWILDRVRAFRFFEEPEGHRWEHGVNRSYMEKLREYWLTAHDWQASVQRINRLHHERVAVEPGFFLHCVHLRSPRADAIPLLIAHGWPGSILEFEQLYARLVQPEDASAPAFHVVAPSLPGYAWSDRPAAPMGPHAVAGLYDKLMAKLGYRDFVFQGGDWGCVIGGWLGLDSRNLRGLHLNGFGVRAADMTPTTDAERQWLVQAAQLHEAETGYMHEQSTKPQTLGYALMDSPMGVAAWFAEKYHGWSDLRDGDGDGAGDPPFSFDILLDTIMIYLTTRTFASATWIYRGVVLEGGVTLPPGQRVEVPTGIASFPRDLLAFPPRAMVERAYQVTHWTDMPRGDHFVGLEEPDLLLASLREFVQGLPPA